ncbi:DUF3514 domain-containing protein [Ehrlichia ruminantium]|uniref:DUF3514 domain-containing protein n=1 Tax=Ehrlichia ruminantium TaxID=779 RepID=UPI0015DC5B24|nr:DUF3514 domain-containing protein [Ehrlichia ruminantium]QLK57490.1 DUF3514 domain-containing protein [Ehrlichia ruminantium]
MKARKDNQQYTDDIQQLNSRTARLNIGSVGTSHMTSTNVPRDVMATMDAVARELTGVMQSNVRLENVHLMQGARPKNSQYKNVFQTPRFNQDLVLNVQNKQLVLKRPCRVSYKMPMTVPNEHKLSYEKYYDPQKYADKQLSESVSGIIFRVQQHTHLAYICYITKNIFCIDTDRNYTINERFRDFFNVTSYHELILYLSKLNVLSQLASVLGFYDFSKFLLYNYELQYLDYYVMDNILISVIDIIKNSERLGRCRYCLSSQLECYADSKVFKLQENYCSRDITFYIAVLQLLQNLMCVRKQMKRRGNVEHRLTSDILDFLIISCCIQVGIGHRDVMLLSNTTFDVNKDQKFIMLLHEISSTFLDLYNLSLHSGNKPETICGVNFSSALLNICSQDIRATITCAILTDELRLNIIYKSIVDNICASSTSEALQDIYMQMMQYKEMQESAKSKNIQRDYGANYHMSQCGYSK